MPHSEGRAFQGKGVASAKALRQEHACCGEEMARWTWASTEVGRSPLM